MKLSIRRGVFETNSSSTHSLTFCKKSEWEDFKNGNLYLPKGYVETRFYNRKEAVDSILESLCEYADDGYYENIFKIISIDDLKDDKKKFKIAEDLLDHKIKMNDDLKDFWRENGFDNYNMWKYDPNVEDYTETYNEEYTSEHGDEIVVFGKFN